MQHDKVSSASVSNSTCREDGASSSERPDVFPEESSLTGDGDISSTSFTVCNKQVQEVV
jgi:hypothetical protein